MSYHKIKNSGIIFYLFGIILMNIPLVNEMYAYEISLDGKWKFAVDSNQIYDIKTVKSQAEWMEAVVPLSWQAQFDKYRDYQRTAWYYKKVYLQKISSDKVVLLKFEAVDYLTEVYVNGNYAGLHEGGYTPFDFEIQEYIHQGENEIIIKVFDPIPGKHTVNGINYAEIPHGKQSWYVQNSGIWQSVYLQIKPRQFIKSVHILPSMDGEVNLKITLNKLFTNENTASLVISILDKSDKEILSDTKRTTLSFNPININLQMMNFEKWSLESPVLYKAKVILNNNDTILEQFGFRKFESKNKKFYLNGKQLYLIGALDQDFYPETIYTPPSEEFIRDEMLKAKKMGLNILRCHIKVPDRRYLKAADETGLLIWYEVPNRDTFTVDGAKRSSILIDEMLNRDWNHPSIVIISLINESWGIDLKDNEQRKWLKREYNRIKEKAKGRLVVDNSACYGNFHIATDINDYHTYWSVPDWHNRFGETIKELSSRPKWLFSSYGDSEEKGDEPLMLSEFGNWGLPKLPDKLPWWLSRTFNEIDITLPSGAGKRFEQYGYNDLFNNLDELSENSQSAQFNALKYEIEQIRLHPEIQGYIITEFTDLNWECNGLLDMQRNFKVYADNLADIQQQDIIIPYLNKYSYSKGESVEINLYLSHYSDKNINNSKLFWDSGKYEYGNTKVGNVSDLGVTLLKTVVIKLTDVREGGSLKIYFRLKNSDNSVIAKNYIEIFVTPKSNNDHYANTVYSYNAIFNNSHSYKSIESISEKTDVKPGDIIVTNTFDNKITKLLGEGLNVLFFPDSVSKIPVDFPFKLTSRTEGWYDGNWISNMNWIKNSSTLFNSMKLKKIMGFEFCNLLPGYVLTEIPPEDFRDVLAGMFVGWLHLNSGYIMQIKAANGILLICTLNIPKVLDKDVFANYLYNKLIDYLRSGSISPKIKWQISSN